MSQVHDTPSCRLVGARRSARGCCCSSSRSRSRRSLVASHGPRARQRRVFHRPPPRTRRCRARRRGLAARARGRCPVGRAHCGDRGSPRRRDQLRREGRAGVRLLRRGAGRPGVGRLPSASLDEVFVESVRRSSPRARSERAACRHPAARGDPQPYADPGGRPRVSHRARQLDPRGPAGRADIGLLPAHQPRESPRRRAMRPRDTTWWPRGPDWRPRASSHTTRGFARGAPRSSRSRASRPSRLTFGTRRPRSPRGTPRGRTRSRRDRGGGRRARLGARGRTSPS